LRDSEREQPEQKQLQAVPRGRELERLGRRADEQSWNVGPNVPPKTPRERDRTHENQTRGRIPPGHVLQVRCPEQPALRCAALSFAGTPQKEVDAGEDQREHDEQSQHVDGEGADEGKEGRTGEQDLDGRDDDVQRQNEQHDADQDAERLRAHELKWAEREASSEPSVASRDDERRAELGEDCFLLCLGEAAAELGLALVHFRFEMHAQLGQYVGFIRAFRQAHPDGP